MDIRLSPFVKDIFQINGGMEKHALPFYADGFPGIMYSKTISPIILQPFGKELPPLFLYGQTIEPIELHIEGSYEIVVFQLHPFATRLLIGVDPKTINDACYDLSVLDEVDIDALTQSLDTASDEQRLELISKFILKLIQASSQHEDSSIKLAVSSILKAKGDIRISELRERLFLTERTFERRFTKEIGVSPKQFARMVQFSFTMDQLKEEDYDSLTEIAYDNGFADQSHFIKSFKKYTGHTPTQLLAVSGQNPL